MCRRSTGRDTRAPPLPPLSAATTPPPRVHVSIGALAVDQAEEKDTPEVALTFRCVAIVSCALATVALGVVGMVMAFA